MLYKSCQWLGAKTLWVGTLLTSSWVTARAGNVHHICSLNAATSMPSWILISLIFESFCMASVALPPQHARVSLPSAPQDPPSNQDTTDALLYVERAMVAYSERFDNSAVNIVFTTCTQRLIMSLLPFLLKDLYTRQRSYPLSLQMAMVSWIIRSSSIWCLSI